MRTLFRYAIEELGDSPQGAADRISGMTDRYALQVFKQIAVPSSWPLGEGFL